MSGTRIRIEQQALEDGRPVVVWPGRDALYVAYDPAQIAEESALVAIRLLVPEVPGLVSAARGGRGKDSSVEGIAEHGGSR